jgi:hypothetical protein
LANKKSRTPTPPRRVQAPAKRVQAPTRKPTTQASAADRRRLWLIGGAVAVLVVIGAVLGFVLSGGSSAATVKWATVSGLQTSPPPWNTGIATVPERLDAIGLDPLPQEALAFHIHSHLDVYWNGKKVTVPAGVGIEPPDQAGQGGFFLALHTHDARGVIHVESPSKKDYTLAQFMGAWGVRLTSRCLADRCGAVKIFVNGKRFTQDPNKLILKSHEEIAVVAGKAPAKIPSSYKGFFQGE